MATVIVGAGRIGSSVLEMATETDTDLTVIERNPERAHQIKSSDHCRVINDDATERETLLTAQVDEADAIITTTEEDATNLMVLMLARDMGCEKLVSVVHKATNIPLFEQLGATIIENPQRLIAEYLFRGIQEPSIQDFMHVGDTESDAEVFELVVEDGAPIAGQSLEEADIGGLLPPSMIVVAVEREGEIIIPRGHTQIETGDFVTIFSKDGITQESISPFGTHRGNSSLGMDDAEE